MLTILDYGLGNINAIRNVYEKKNISPNIASSINSLEQASKIILPGVGSFDWAMSKLNKSGMRDLLDLMVTEKKVPVLGICVGMQMMAKSSEEGSMDGLGWLNASVKKFYSEKQNIKLPHMGWNTVNFKDSKLTKDLVNPRFYFLHSFYFALDDISQTLGETNYSFTFSSAINLENIYGVQFHPEKSHGWGETLLLNFANL